MSDETPTLAELLRLAARWEQQQMQTTFPAKVTKYDSGSGTVEVLPQFFEVYRDEEGTRITSGSEVELTPIPNVPIAFPRYGDFRITGPTPVGSFGMVHCTKYSLDVWREAATAGDPGDLRMFSLSGAVFEPVNLHPNDSYIKHDDGDYIALTAGGAVDPAIRGEDLRSWLESTCKVLSPFGPLSLDPAQLIATTTFAPPLSKKVKIE